MCWQHCKPGYVDIGALCRQEGSIETYAKSSYGRGVGVVLGCTSEQDADAGLCYGGCNEGFYGIGPVCWATCPPSNPTDGGALCCTDAETCSEKVLALSLGLPLAVAKAVLSGGDPAAVTRAVIDAISSLLGFVMPICASSE